MRVKTVPGGPTYTGPFKPEDIPNDKEGCDKLAALGNKKAEKLGIKTRYEVEED